MTVLHVPPKLTPWAFKLATTSDSVVKRDLVGLYAGLVVLYLAISTYVIGAALTLSGVLKVVGLVGDGIALGVLLVSSVVERSSQERYVAAYTKRAKDLYPKDSDAQTKTRLEEFFGILKSKTSNILKLDVGSILLAVSTVLAFVGGLVKG